MRQVSRVFQQHLVRITALILIIPLYQLARLPTLSATEQTQLAGRFRFEHAPIPELTDQPFRSIRAVHPSLERISAWISSVGAAVALNDLDGDGLPNDICYVDTRIDRVVITPAPGTPQRYQPFALNPAPLSYAAETTAPMGCLPGDMNEDGLRDVLVYYWGRTPIAFLRSAAAIGLAADSYLPHDIVGSGERWFSNAATFADLDGDGHVDLVIGNYFPDNANILDSTGMSGEHMQASMSRAYNGGSKRLLRWTAATAGAAPTVSFEEARNVLDSAVNSSWTLAIAACDLDGDLLPELYFSNDFGPDRLLHNRSVAGQIRFARLEGQDSFTTPSSKVLGHDSYKGMGVDCGDLNLDGYQDFFVSNITAQYALEESNFAFISTGETERMADGVAPYVDHSEPMGLSRSNTWGWDSRLNDFDNDGILEALQASGFLKGQFSRWPELHELAMGNDLVLRYPESWPRFQQGDDLSGHQHVSFFVRSSSDRYYDIAQDVGVGDIQVSRAIATADVDGDGRLDFAVGNQWETSSFYHNQSPAAGAFLGLNLLLPIDAQPAAATMVRDGHPQPATPGRAAIGATATVHLPDGRMLVAQVDGGNGHSGKRSQDLHFGLGNLSPTTPVEVELRWRAADGQIQQQRFSMMPGWHTVLLGS
ncbi:MAG TPA: FG-GAP-like repeat-containing protein [Herpetosiphonaceae bacterium]